MAIEVRKSKVLAPLFAVRDWFMNVTGLFKLKAKLCRKWRFFKIRVEDERKRRRIREQIHALPDDYVHVANKQRIPIVVSTTSYGHRLGDYAPYALYSILRQNILPERIIVNIDKNSWTDDTLPELMKQMIRLGVEVCYVDDLGPYTKLLPTLEQKLNKIIITVDDDIYYDEGMIAELYDAYLRSDKKTILCRDGKAVNSVDGKILMYSANPHASKPANTPHIIPFGVAGVLYPPQIVYPQVMFNRELISKLCPKADDVWFGLVELHAKIQTKYIFDNSWGNASPVDRCNEYNEKGSSALHFMNDEHNMNDSQWMRVCEYFTI